MEAEGDAYERLVALLENEEVFFDTVRLDRSVALNTEDYAAVA